MKPKRTLGYISSNSNLAHQFKPKCYPQKTTPNISTKWTTEPKTVLDDEKEEELCGNGCNTGAVPFLKGALGECEGGGCEAGGGDVGWGGGGARFAMTVTTTFSPSSHRVWFPLMKKYSPDLPKSKIDLPPNSLRYGFELSHMS